ncbi:hypothetical protein [Dyadobacter frigoris]|uniref:Lipoprotein n=1 Tax=Dyadobacter frigoris TaxID=2576211 RepID=A0A4U6D2G5_9BACT|nr:hypothetical protein [Dyadobacter frigoris]TKT91430.1 hypothetical protein FDK13_13740 [Dyadobacter frigoris]
MKRIIAIFLINSLMAVTLLTSCSRQMDQKSKKIKTTENKTEGYLYYQNDQSSKGDSTIKKNVNN